MGRLFGTDGARGVAITELTCEMAMQIGRAAALVLTKEAKHRAKIFIGKDTRISSDILEAALCAGICSVGAEAVKLGVVPTPAVAYLVRTHGADAGVMISASHNSVEFNGIKLFAATGYKLPDATEEEIEALILDHPEKIELQSDIRVGAISEYTNAKEDYISYLAGCVATDCSGIRVALDCANGSASAIAKNVFDALGAETHVINNHPNGLNINTDCGSTHIHVLQEYVKESGCDVGFAYDGDADRCIAVDENGSVVDGDLILYICGKYMKEIGTLRNNTVVTTIMSNFGLYKAFDREGISYEKTAVGDKYVYENMSQYGNCLGGEQSGHIIFSKHATTGDGILTSLKVMEVMLEKKETLGKLASEVEILPQVLKNVRVKDKKAAQDDPAVQAEVAKVTETLGADGRILLRQSGTEPVVRVMVEAPTTGQCEMLVDQVIEVMKAQGHVL